MRIFTAKGHCLRPSSR